MTKEVYEATIKAILDQEMVNIENAKTVDEKVNAVLAANNAIQSVIALYTQK